jgi:FkbM family methyltransferase
MTMKERIKSLVEGLAGIRIYRALPRGIDLFDDIKNYLPNLRVNIIFDVGANIGQSAKTYLKKYHAASIYCFEPVDATFRQLQKNLRGHNNIQSFKLALGVANGTGQMILDGNSDMFFLLNTAQDVEVNSKSRTEQVDVGTLDSFCGSHNVTSINYLKIDTEGGDFNVLTGAVNMLAKQQIDLVEVEAGTNPGNKRHVSLEKLKAFLEDRRYFLFGIYEQENEWPKKQPHLRRINPVFISDKVIKTNIVGQQLGLEPVQGRGQRRTSVPNLLRTD